jgi:uncharacterized SAM-binding protein YcdF (DUF218 family)
MFFTFSKVVTFLLDPIFFIFFLFLICLIKSKVKIRFRMLLVVLYGCLYLLSTHFVADLTTRFLEHLKPSSPLKSRYDAVIVLSGMVHTRQSTPENIEFGGAVERILTGIKLIKSNSADYMIISGGDGSLFQEATPEAQLLKEFAVGMGIDPQRIIVEGASKNTYENAVESAKIIEERGFDDLLLVTSAFHMYRSYGCFTKAGVKVDTLSVDFNGNRNENRDFRRFLPSSSGLNASNQFIHEVIGIIVYLIGGKAKPA